MGPGGKGSMLKCSCPIRPPGLQILRAAELDDKSEMPELLEHSYGLWDDLIICLKLSQA